MKLWIFKNGINVTEATFYIQNLLCGNMSRNFKMISFCSLFIVLTNLCSALYSFIQKKIVSVSTFGSFHNIMKSSQPIFF